jgi:predicted acyltransferase
MSKHSNRIQSIDALRGLDMLAIIFADNFFRSLNKAFDNPLTQGMAEQFQHASWIGFRVYDMVMPLFLFLVGAVIPFSLSKYTNKTSNGKKVYYRIIKRFIILFILGWIVQGNLLHWDLSKFKIFSNTLQAIAMGYLFSSIFYLNFKTKYLYLIFGTCITIYALALGLFNNDLQPDNNLAIIIDKYLFGTFEDNTKYTWALSSINFTATVLSGLFAGLILKSKNSDFNKLKKLVLLGVGFIIGGLIFNQIQPSIKIIWTSAFVFISSGISYLLLALFFWLIDIKKFRKWSFWLKVIGMNAIFAYVTSHVIYYRGISHKLLFGLKQHIGDFYDLINCIGGFLILYFILWYMYKNKSFIKI